MIGKIIIKFLEERRSEVRDKFQLEIKNILFKFSKKEMWNFEYGQEREEIIKYRTKNVRVFWEEEGRFVVV
jgi:hypothetical protein